MIYYLDLVNQGGYRNIQPCKGLLGIVRWFQENQEIPKKIFVLAGGR